MESTFCQKRCLPDRCRTGLRVRGTVWDSDRCSFGCSGRAWPAPSLWSFSPYREFVIPAGGSKRLHPACAPQGAECAEQRAQPVRGSCCTGTPVSWLPSTSPSREINLANVCPR